MSLSLENVRVYTQSAIRIEGAHGTVAYLDPFSLTDATSAGADPGLGMMLRLALLALGYMLLHLLTATWIFSRKEF